MIENKLTDDIKKYSNLACILDREMISKLLIKTKKYLKNMKNYDINKIELFLEKEINNIFILQRKNLHKNQSILKKKIKTHVKTLKKHVKSRKLKTKYNKYKHKTLQNIIDNIQDNNIKKYINSIDNKDFKKKYNISKDSSLDEILSLVFKKINIQIK